MVDNYNASPEPIRIIVHSRVSDLLYSSGTMCATFPAPIGRLPFGRVALELLAYDKIETNSLALHFAIEGARPCYINKIRAPVIHTWIPVAGPNVTTPTPKFYPLETAPESQIFVSIRDERGRINIEPTARIVFQLVFA